MCLSIRFWSMLRRKQRFPPSIPCIAILADRVHPREAPSGLSPRIRLQPLSGLGIRSRGARVVLALQCRRVHGEHHGQRRYRCASTSSAVPRPSRGPSATSACAPWGSIASSCSGATSPTHAGNAAHASRCASAVATPTTAGTTMPRVRWYASRGRCSDLRGWARLGLLPSADFDY